MRKRNVSYLFDTFMWYLIYLLPLFFWLGMSLIGKNFVTLESVFTSAGFGFITDNFITTGLSNIVGVNGVMPLFNNGIIIYMSYFICIMLVHLFVDFLAWLPRLIHHWMNIFGGNKNE